MNNIVSVLFTVGLTALLGFGVKNNLDAFNEANVNINQQEKVSTTAGIKTNAFAATADTLQQRTPKDTLASVQVGAQVGAGINAQSSLTPSPTQAQQATSDGQSNGSQTQAKQGTNERQGTMGNQETQPSASSATNAQTNTASSATPNPSPTEAPQSNVSSETSSNVSAQTSTTIDVPLHVSVGGLNVSLGL